MELNSFLFPAPSPSYSIHGAIGDVVYIPRPEKSEEADRSLEEIPSRKQEDALPPFLKPHPIPCLYMPFTQGSSKIMVYFHGNAEDVGLASELLDYVRSLLRVNLLAVEYPGYGIYDGKPTAE